MRFGVFIPLNLVVALVLGIALVWLSIERIQIGYAQRKLVTERQELLALVDKLKAERNNLVSPYALHGKAEAFGLQHARPGQFRRLEAQDGQGRKSP